MIRWNQPLAVALACFGCASTPELTLQPRVELTGDDYADVLKDWTRTDKLYDALDSVLFVHATFHSPEFRKVFLMRHPDVYGPGSEQANRLMLTNPNAELFHEFFMSAWTSDARWNDFESENSIWQVTLYTDGGEQVVGEVQKVRATANIRAIYAYITDFSETYRVRFPLVTVTGNPVITNRTEDVRLRVASALGHVELKWKLKTPQIPRQVAQESGGDLPRTQ